MSRAELDLTIFEGKMAYLRSKALKIKHAVIVAIMSFSSWLVSYALSYLGIMKDQFAVFTAGVICLSVVAACSAMLFSGVKKVDPLLYGEQKSNFQSSRPIFFIMFLDLDLGR